MSTDFVAATFPVLSGGGLESIREAEQRAAVRGHAAGYAAGRREAEAESATRGRELEEALQRATSARAAEMDAVVRGLDDVRTALQMERDRAVGLTTETVLALAVELAELIVERSLADEAATASAALARVLASAGETAVVEVRLHPDDLAMLRTTEVGGIRLTPDASLRRGDARGSFESGGVDASLASAVRRVRDALAGGAA